MLRPPLQLFESSPLPASVTLPSPYDPDPPEDSDVDDCAEEQKRLAKHGGVDHLDEWRWIPLPALKVHRHAAAVAAIDNTIIVAGGSGSGGAEYRGTDTINTLTY